MQPFINNNILSNFKRQEFFSQNTLSSSYFIKLTPNTSAGPLTNILHIVGEKFSRKRMFFFGKLVKHSEGAVLIRNVFHESIVEHLFPLKSPRLCSAVTFNKFVSKRGRNNFFFVRDKARRFSRVKKEHNRWSWSFYTYKIKA